MALWSVRRATLVNSFNTAGSDYDLTDRRATGSSTLTGISRSLETCPLDLGQNFSDIRLLHL
jgi:hypothetical protein